MKTSIFMKGLRYFLAVVSILILCSSNHSLFFTNKSKVLAEAFTTNVSTNTSGCADTTNSIKAWYQMSGSVMNFFGNHQPSLTNNISFTDGKVGQGVTFGQGGFIEIPETEDLRLQRITIETWVKPLGPGPNNDFFGGKIFSKDLPMPEGNRASTLAINWSNDNRFIFGFGAFDDGVEKIISTNTFPTGVFHHVAATYDGQIFKLYVNGQLEGQMPLVKTLNYDSALPFCIGSTSASYRAVGFPRTFDGVIDELAIYDRALTDTEIANIVLADSLGKCSSPNNPSSLDFSSATYNVDEGDIATITVTRIGNTSNVVNVDYSIFGGTASAGIDHVASSGSLTFNSGEVSKNILIQTTEDTLVEGNETINISLSNPIGATLGSLSTATVTIIDDGTPTCTTQPSGLIHWWPANNNSLDIIGGGNATLLNGVQYSQGKVAESWSFDGVDDDASTPVTLNYSNGITFECWVKTTDNDGLLMADTGTTDETGMGLFIENGLIHLGFYKSTPNINNFSIHGSFVSDGQFHHIVGTWTGDTTIDGAKLYVDGNVVGKDTALTTIGSTTKTINFGWIVGSRYFALAGLIDEASIYNRALTSQEILSIFNAGSNGKCTTVATPGTIQLSDTTYTVNETDGTVTITVIRTNGSDGTITIDYSTSNGSAMAGADYNAASGTLTFANGETTKTFNITLLPDSLTESNETFNITLSNPTGGTTLGNTSTAVITITDNSSQACQQELATALQQIQSLQSQISTLTQQNSQLQSQITSLTQANQTLTEQNTQLQSQLNTANQTISNLNNQITQLQDQVNALTQQNTQLQTANAQLQSQLNTANQTIQDQQLQISGLQDQLDTANQMLATCQTQLLQVQDELNNLQSPKQQISTAKQQIQALLATAPNNAQSNLNNSLKDLTNAQLSIAVGNLERGLREIRSANQDLINAANKGVNTTSLQQILVQGVAVRVTKAVNDVEALLGSSNQKVQEAKALLQQGQNLLAQGNFKNALDSFIDALQKADSAKP